VPSNYDECTGWQNLTLSSRAPEEANEEKQCVKGVLTWHIFLAHWLWSDVKSMRIGVTEVTELNIRDNVR
jgi:hypothetical protein